MKDGHGIKVMESIRIPHLKRTGVFFVANMGGQRQLNCKGCSEGYCPPIQVAAFSAQAIPTTGKDGKSPPTDFRGS